MKVYTCHACGGAMEWDGAAGGLKCSRCGTAVKIEDTETLGYHSCDTLPTGLQGDQDKVIHCQGCGAEIKADCRTLSMSCPNCGASLVFDDSQLSYVKPDGVAPFRISRDCARKLVKEWYGRHWFAPGFASHSLDVEFSSPHYIPFWVFKAHIEGEYSGRGGKDITFVLPNSIHGIGFGGREGYLDKAGLIKAQTVTSWEDIHGTVSEDLENFGVLADSSIDHEYARLLFRSTPAGAFVQWKPEYFAGCSSFLPGVLAGDAAEQAKKDMRNDLERRTRMDIFHKSENEKFLGFNFERVKYNQVEFSSFYADCSNMSWRLVQIPAYFAICRCHGRIYVSAVNGATGEVFGTCPVSYLRIIIAIVFAAAAALAGVEFFMPESVSVCTEGGCQFSWGAFSATAGIIGAIALLVYVCIYFLLKSSDSGRDSQENSPWIREIMEKAK